MPADWTEGVIIRTPKKGALSNCTNWRCITLLSVPSKILTKIIIKRISDALTLAWGRNRQAFGVSGDAEIRSSHYAAS